MEKKLDVIAIMSLVGMALTLVGGVVTSMANQQQMKQNVAEEVAKVMANQ